MRPHRFSIQMTVRASDLNYGNHVGYQTFFAFFQEARIAYLNQFGYTELDIDGYGIIVAEANCKYKQELLLNDTFEVACAITKLKSKGFVMEYDITRDDTKCAKGFTQNLCYDYTAQRVMRLPKKFVQVVEKYEARNK